MEGEWRRVPLQRLQELERDANQSQVLTREIAALHLQLARQGDSAGSVRRRPHTVQPSAQGEPGVGPGAMRAAERAVYEEKLANMHSDYDLARRELSAVKAKLAEVMEKQLQQELRSHRQGTPSLAGVAQTVMAESRQHAPALRGTQDNWREEESPALAALRSKEQRARQEWLKTHGRSAPSKAGGATAGGGGRVGRWRAVGVQVHPRDVSEASGEEAPPLDVQLADAQAQARAPARAGAECWRGGLTGGRWRRWRR